MKKAIGLIGLGLVNLLHAGLHIAQFIQSLLLIRASTLDPHEDNVVEEIIHNPILAIVWGLVGLYTLYVGIKDFRHHKRCT